MPGSESPVGAAVWNAELLTVTLRQEPKKSRTEQPEGRAGIPVPDMGRAETSGSTRQDQCAYRQVLEMVLYARRPRGA